MHLWYGRMQGVWDTQKIKLHHYFNMCQGLIYTTEKYTFINLKQMVTNLYKMAYVLVIIFSCHFNTLNSIRNKIEELRDLKEYLYKN